MTESLNFSAFKLQCEDLNPQEFKPIILPIQFLNWLAYTKFETQAWRDFKKLLLTSLSNRYGLDWRPVSVQRSDFEEVGLSKTAIKHLFFPYFCMSIFDAVDIANTFIADFIKLDLEKESFVYYVNTISKLQ